MPVTQHALSSTEVLYGIMDIGMCQGSSNIHQVQPFSSLISEEGTWMCDAEWIGMQYRRPDSAQDVLHCIRHHVNSESDVCLHENTHQNALPKERPHLLMELIGMIWS